MGGGLRGVGGALYFTDRVRMSCVLWDQGMPKFWHMIAKRVEKTSMVMTCIGSCVCGTASGQGSRNSQCCQPDLLLVLSSCTEQE